MCGITITSLLPLPKQVKHAKAVARDAGKVGQKLQNLFFTSKIESSSFIKKKKKSIRQQVWSI